jgi:hypothetical protein
MRCGLAIAMLLLSSLLAGQTANAAGGCGAGLYRDAYGQCRFYRAGPYPYGASPACPIGYIWRNGRCRQNVWNDPFVSTWPNAPRDRY